MQSLRGRTPDSSCGTSGIGAQCIRIQRTLRSLRIHRTLPPESARNASGFSARNAAGVLCLRIQRATPPD
eukprot:6275111-Alexandrium_andersonii.AAC.1